MRLVFLNEDKDICAQLFGLDALPELGESCHLDNGVIVTNATPMGRHFIETLDITLIINFDFSSFGDFLNNTVQDVAIGICSTWLYDVLKKYIINDNNHLMIDGEIVKDEKDLLEKIGEAVDSEVRQSDDS